jgi:hypothetical protein
VGIIFVGTSFSFSLESRLEEEHTTIRPCRFISLHRMRRRLFNHKLDYIYASDVAFFPSFSLGSVLKP